jgi:lipoate-protein ligase A
LNLGTASSLQDAEGARNVKGADSMAHGEYKTPGGKLVQVDFSMENGRIQQPVISGDFFLYPDEALEPITAALDGLATTLDEEAIATAVRLAIPAGADLVGTSPEGIAIAVRRAVASTEDTDE